MQHALAHQQSVLALVRKQEDADRLAAMNIQIMIGDACDENAVTQVCQAAGPDAVIVSTMGGSHDYPAHRTVIDCAEQAGIRKMLMVTSLGCGDSWSTLSDRAKQAFGQAVREKSLAESWCKIPKYTDLSAALMWH